MCITCRKKRQIEWSRTWNGPTRISTAKGWSHNRPAYYATINKVIFGLVIVPVARKGKPVEVNVPEEKDSVGNFFQIKTRTLASQWKVCFSCFCAWFLNNFF